ncbi:hypothetical protein [Planomonospora sp. ID82291]|uniref:hypothetical protein n=1 Tax=Planomonospora sp. ID82291 TaxID=2738136 RepID=UPI0018C362F4|nr:hypothetical protein [Planomonospora sp. ID82291]MBG0818323.1 hypothetical protein [Planomonospora sp. ID82291]
MPQFDPATTLQTIGLPRRLTASTLVAHYAQALSRDIRLAALPGLAATTGWCGLWIRGDDEVDHIFVDQATTAVSTLETHVVAHEIGHIAAGHDQGVTAEAGLIAMLKERFPTLPPHVIVRAVMARTTYELQAEHEAERFATLVMARASLQSGTSFGRAAARMFISWKEPTS